MIKMKRNKLKSKISLGKVSIIFSNRVIYSGIVFLILAIVGVGVWAYANPTTGVGHDFSELQPCSKGLILKSVNIDDANPGLGTKWSCVKDEGFTNFQIERISCNNGNSCDELSLGSVVQDSCPAGYIMGGCNAICNYNEAETCSSSIISDTTCYVACLKSPGVSCSKSFSVNFNCIKLS